MKSSEIRSRFLNFFEAREHAVLPSASLVPENDPSVLFNTAGMQPLVPYLLGEKHPLGTRLANIQKCVRTGDIDEIGDNTHATFFEMMGNWSLGDYFKKDAIAWSFELLTNKEVGFGLDPQRLYVTCFEGNEDAPKDTESAEIWRSIFEKAGVTGERIYFMPAKNNWWSAGETGPCGPDTEMFYDLTGKHASGMTKEQYLEADDKQEVVEIWNNVFMEFKKQLKPEKQIEYEQLKQKGFSIPSNFFEYSKLPKQNVDTGSGFERVCAVLQKKDNIFDTDLFLPIINKIREHSSLPDQKSERIIADHIRTAVFMIGDGVIPSNKDAGYILRRLIRRSVRSANKINLSIPLAEIGQIIISEYENFYIELRHGDWKIINEINAEENTFREKLKEGTKWFNEMYEMIVVKQKQEGMSGIDAFHLFQTYGFPYELTEELAKERGLVIDKKEFDEAMKNHQEISRAGAEQKFKGGLAGTGEVETRYHTATHLLHQALRDVLGDTVQQKGSNITAERLRFDFTHPQKMTDEEKKKVEDIVNKKIAQKLPMQKVVMKKEDAEKTGALHFFGDKYADEVSVYFIGDSLETAYSKEFCGGPHVTNTGELGVFKITKEEAVSAGVRRIKAVLT